MAKPTIYVIHTDKEGKAILLRENKVRGGVKRGSGYYILVDNKVVEVTHCDTKRLGDHFVWGVKPKSGGGIRTVLYSEILFNIGDIIDMSNRSIGDHLTIDDFTKTYRGYKLSPK